MNQSTLSRLAARLASWIRLADHIAGLAGTVAAPPVLRIALALPFIRSGLTRWDGFLKLSIGSQFLFEQQFKLHIFGSAYDIPAPDQVAFLVGIAELALPALLILGLGTRLAALGLLIMTGIIQLVVPEGWANFHLYWAGLALAIMHTGGGPLSVDRLIAVLCRRSPKGQVAMTPILTQPAGRPSE